MKTFREWWDEVGVKEFVPSMEAVFASLWQLAEQSAWEAAARLSESWGATFPVYRVGGTLEATPPFAGQIRFHARMRTPEGRRAFKEKLDADVAKSLAVLAEKAT